MTSTMRHEVGAILLASVVLSYACNRTPSAGSEHDADGGALDGSASPTPDATDDAAAEEDDRSFDVHAELQRRLRESPDHRAARADALVAEGDPERIFAFVRDEIRTVPALRLRTRFLPYQDRMMFGARGALRGGVGTPRDKAELLRWLFERAGFSARVKIGFADEDHRDPARLFGAKTPPPFAPPVTDEDLRRWSEWFGAELPTRNVPITDPDGTNARALTDALRALVGPGADFEVYPDLTASRLPFVEVDLPDGPVFANPLFDDLAFGESGAGNLVTNASPAETTSTTVRVFARHTEDRDPLGRTLVEGTWSDADLIGRRLVFRMRPPMELSELLVTRIDQIPMFLPTLALEGSSLDDGEATELSRAGPLVTWTNDVVERTPDGRIRISGTSFAESDTDGSLASIESLECDLDASHYPNVRLTLRPRDAASELVPGLRADDFVFDEDGVNVGAVLRSNQSVPRLLFVADRSTSVPEAFRGEGLKALGLAIAEAVFAHPDGEASVMYVGERVDQEQPFTSDPVALAAQFDRTAGGGSRLFSALAQAVRRRPTLVVMITDGVLEGESFSPEIADAIARTGVPALVLGVGSQSTETLAQLADASGGRYEPVADPDVAQAQVEAYLATEVEPYPAVYRAPTDGPTRRTLRVTTADGRHSIRLTYDAPTIARTPGGFVGLYMTISRDGQSVTRTLAGIGPEAPISDADAATIEQVEASFFGSVTLLVEGGAPSFSQVIDDQLEGMLSLRSLALAAARDPSEFEARLDEGSTNMPFPAYRHLLGARDLDDDAVPTGPRFALYAERPAREASDGERRIDLLPLTRFVGLAETHEAAWEASLRRSTIDALLEARYFPHSTVQALDGELLSVIPAETVGSHFSESPLRTSWIESARAFDAEWSLLVPSDGEPVAFWAVHEPTGTTLAILEGGGGAGSMPGGGGSVPPAVSVAETLSYLYGLTGLKGGVWLNLEVAKAKQIARATAAIAALGTGTAAPTPPGLDPESTVASFVCGEAENAVLDGLPAAIRAAVATYNRLASAQGHPKLCP